MRHRVDAIIESDVDEGDFAQVVDDLLYREFGDAVKDLEVYQVVYLPSDAEKAREARRARWKPQTPPA